MMLALIVYAVGVVVGWLRTDAPAPARLGLALVWPLAPLALLTTICVLVAVAIVALPGRRKER